MAGGGRGKKKVFDAFAFPEDDETKPTKVQKKVSKKKLAAPQIAATKAVKKSSDKKSTNVAIKQPFFFKTPKTKFMPQQPVFIQQTSSQPKAKRPPAKKQKTQAVQSARKHPTSNKQSQPALDSSGKTDLAAVYRSLTNDELRQDLKSRGLEVGGVKADLIARLQKADSEIDQVSNPKKTRKRARPQPVTPVVAQKNPQRPVMSFVPPSPYLSSPGGSVDTPYSQRPNTKVLRKRTQKEDKKRKVGGSCSRPTAVGGYVQFISPPRLGNCVHDVSPIPLSRDSPAASPFDGDFDKENEDNENDNEDILATDVIASPRKLVQDLAAVKPKKKQKRRLQGRAKVEHEKKMGKILDEAKSWQDEAKKFYDDLDNEPLESFFEIA